MNSYIFILCPPYSGSTVLWKLLSTSPAVSSLPNEGQKLPEVESIMRRDSFNSENKFPWAYIKSAWARYWDYEKPLLLEKSPPNMFRTDDIVKHFSPIHFVIMIRNPYAHCEGLMRHGNRHPTHAAEFTARCLRQQRANAESLASSLRFTYEEMVAQPDVVSQRLQSFIPQLGPLDVAARFSVHSIDGKAERGFTDFNGKKIANLAPWQITAINKVLHRNADVMEYWGYEFYEPSVRRTFLFLGTRASLLFSNTVSKGKRLPGRVARKLRRAG